MIGFHLRKMYKFIYKQISPKCDYLGYFSLRTWLYFCIVFICGIATSAYYDVKELIRPSLFSPGHDFKKPNFWRVWSQISLEVFIHFKQDIYHSNRLVTANFWKKNGDHVICTLRPPVKVFSSHYDRILCAIYRLFYHEVGKCVSPGNHNYLFISIFV